MTCKLTKHPEEKPSLTTAISAALLTVLFAGLAIMPGTALANTTPEAFELEIEGRFYFGVGIRLSGKQSLEYRGDDVWRLVLEARGPLTRLDERSDFKWQDGKMVPLDYRYRLRAPFEREERRVRFEPDNNRVRATVNGSTTEHEYNPEWHDPLSFTYQLLLDLKQDIDRVEYQVVDRRDARTYEFERVSSSRLPDHAVIMSQIQPDRGTIYMITDTEKMLPSHLIRWDGGSIEYQIQTLTAKRSGTTYEDFPHWPNPRRNLP